MNPMLIAIDPWQRINYALYHANFEHVVRSIEVPKGLRARLRVAGFSEEMSLPPGKYGDFSPRLDAHMFARLQAATETQIVIEIDGHEPEMHPVLVTPLCAWDQQKGYADATAAYVLENDPVIADLVRQAGTAPDPGGDLPPVERTAERLYRELVPFFGPCYLFQRTLFPPSEQAVRFPLQMKYDLGGTCLDFCLAYAAALLKSSVAPLLVILGDAQGPRHSLVGVWLSGPPAVRPPDGKALESARRAGLWVPIEVTWALRGETYEEARRKAEEQLERFPLLWGVDILAARRAEIDALPGRPCTTTFNHWEVRTRDERTKTLATAAAETLHGLAVEVLESGHPADLEKRWELTSFRARIGRGYRHDIGLLEATVSDPHAVIFAEGGEIHLADLFSKGRVRLDDGYLPPGQSRPIPVGQVFQVGAVKLRLTTKSERRLADATDR